MCDAIQPERPTLILGIESSCDETSCALVADGRQVHSNVVASQIELHARYGGVVPEIASRAHLEAVNTVIAQALEQAGKPREEITAIAIANQPGLIGSLLIGLMAAKTLAWAWGKPLIAVNHIHAHAYSPALDAEPIDYPAVALVASGGHTSLYRCGSPTDVELIGATIDDAAGEAFDKVAAILKLGFPGGPAVDRVARNGDPKAVELPRTLLKGQSLDFSFSGIKTAVLYHVNGVPGAVRSVAAPAGGGKGAENLSPQEVADIAASFQSAVVDVLCLKLRRAVKATSARTIVIGGGVAANSALRAGVIKLGAKLNVAVRMPHLKYCGDNAAMIAGLAYHLLRGGQTVGLDLNATATVRR